MAEQQSSRFLAIARIIRPQGRRGEVIAEPATDFPGRFSTLQEVYVESEPSPSPVRLEASWRHKGRIVLKLAGVDSINAASRLRGRYVLIPFEQRAPLPENSYYWSELVGCRIILASGKAGTAIGTVTAVEPTGGVALLHVARDSDDSGELLIPFARAICTHIDPGAKRIEINPPEDLLELNES